MYLVTSSEAQCGEAVRTVDILLKCHCHELCVDKVAVTWPAKLDKCMSVIVVNYVNEHNSEFSCRREGYMRSSICF